ncbi:NAD(P)-dependent iron-only hydrogenase diaphorase component iron-sulfur protein [Caloramator quimbayensis]|uniref:NAD(P)-dependent iron-only hydrogenase diaphorase component iron-sulfur protein n=1 Tax=Caloramator quimbayensis TaxID=1147123 RepID=A0A1T4XYK3_9CLOT|nr:NADH-quinone oxidoreductase subunit NuoE [Caloramator quimbayensis]SKA94473.1 NAD(P)-dependent iron-only hydrogenase diaphorase component iron-sulfur protein [Caloramator quimbayensis]
MPNEQKCCCNCGCNEKDDRLEKALEIINSYKDVKGGLMPVLQQIQNIYGYLPEDVLKKVSDELNIPMSEIYGVATFYSFFSLKPKGEHIIRVCLGTACYVKGAQQIIDKISEELNVEVNDTTKDGKFTLEATRCLGACGLAPVMMIDSKVYGRLTPDDVPGILKEYEQE